MVLFTTFWFLMNEVPGARRIYAMTLQRTLQQFFFSFIHSFLITVM